ncbi:ABC transporter ATP-binding protein [Priestia aryabhattai]|uniref:staphylopine uptake ABC transporter ATP-binding protein CntD n=1 Tax=Priestia aryabhattai TaxID=412384 RepID=UPI00399F879A
MSLLKVEQLHVFDCETNKPIIHNSSFQVNEGECVALVGESGSGKSMTCKSIMRLHKKGIKQSGHILLKGEELCELSERQMRSKRGKELCMVMQNGMSAFNPSNPVGKHLVSTLKQHKDWSYGQMEKKIADAMKRVRLQNSIDIMNKYPHQLSGGMLQRLMIALALLLEPDVLIADEPTTALDTISQFDVIEQLMNLRENTGLSMIFISHDLGIVKKLADQVIVMKDGYIVERGAAQNVFLKPQHAYTEYLISTKRTLCEHFQKMIGGAVHA